MVRFNRAVGFYSYDFHIAVQAGEELTRAGAFRRFNKKQEALSLSLRRPPLLNGKMPFKRRPPCLRCIKRPWNFIIVC